MGRLVSRAVALLALTFGAAQAQSVDPPFAIYQGRARSSILLGNPSLYPLAFVIEPVAFDIAACGDLGLAPLDTMRVHLSLSAMSGRLPAKQQRRIFYEAWTDSLPAWFALKIAFGPARRDSGLGMRIELTHFVYLMQEAPVLPAEIIASAAIFDRERRRLAIRVENVSGKLTRLHSVGVVDADGEEHALDACPVLPHRAREFEFPWTAPRPPQAVRLRFPGFVLERPIVLTGRAPDRDDPAARRP